MFWCFFFTQLFTAALHFSQSLWFCYISLCNLVSYWPPLLGLQLLPVSIYFIIFLFCEKPLNSPLLSFSFLLLLWALFQHSFYVLLVVSFMAHSCKIKQSKTNFHFCIICGFFCHLNTVTASLKKRKKESASCKDKIRTVLYYQLCSKTSLFIFSV